MEALSNYNIKEYNFTIWFFRLLMGIAATLIILVFALQINDSVAIREGEIVATNPQSDYKAPFEAQIVKIYVKEGQPVKAGDTLLVMNNLDFGEQQAKTSTEIEYLQKKIQSVSVLLDAVQKKKAAVEQTSTINARKYELDNNRLITDLKTLKEQFALQKERLASAQEKYLGDAALFKKDMLSKYEYNSTKDAYLSLKENLTSLKNEQNKLLAERNLSYNNFTNEQNNLLLSKLQLDENTQELLQTKNDLEGQLLQTRETLRKVDKELQKQYVIAANSGIVNFLFSTKLTSNLISRGDLLVSVAPDSRSYYAKVIVPEKDMPYVKAGQEARLKLDAYQRLEYGMIRGKVLYLAERKESEKFYALVQLLQNDRYKLKSGYTIHGEIVVQRLPLYKFFIKKIFKRFDKV
ncbi:HlyD family secretion protein [Adhaeribacter radiodurans]|uniref:HlyD family efflux transporter periplasmic adaptor subunit n=1 Tax=Adhaeribacter radiodurans TaxID=2745197 RepID=A0A7L7LC84_9BACT|nr:HlyD family efflux transporter periplasmic adaptor subunit [Adhaeribacter radiodurans]QMU30458.1 HlyD family efflux transporter periplasmic adaptor subunit [Adhaeribacter radiodurans]